MEKELKDCLRQGESVCWQGVPVDFPLLDNANTRSILLKWILTVVIAGGVLIPYLKNQQEISMGFIGLLTLVVVLIVVSPVVERWSLKQQHYWITNQRAILMTRDKSIYYMELDQIDAYKLLTDMAAGPVPGTGRVPVPGDQQAAAVEGLPSQDRHAEHQPRQRHGPGFLQRQQCRRRCGSFDQERRARPPENR